MQKPKLVIDSAGTIELIYRDDLRGLLAEGSATIARASHVEPTMDGQWTADMGPSGGPVLGPFDTRTAALLAEIEWLNDHRL